MTFWQFARETKVWFQLSVIQDYVYSNIKILMYTMSQKTIPPLTCYNLDIRGSITIIFGTCITQNVGNQKVLYFRTLLDFCFCTTWGNRKP